MPQQNRIHLKIITPNGVFFEGDVIVLTAKTTEGYVGIMCDHEPFVAALVISTLFINFKGSKDGREAAISGGLLYSDKKNATVITDAIEYKEDINVARAKQAKLQAEQALKTIHDQQEILKVETALKRAMNRINTSEGHF